MDRLIVTAALKTPLILGGGYLTFDALLAALIFEKTGDVQFAHSNIPLKCTDGVFHGSAAIVEPIDPRPAAFVANMRADHAVDPDWLEKNKHGKLRHKLGRTRRRDFGPVMNTYTQAYVSSITWYCEGNAERINELVWPVQFIGKRRGSGFGQVDQWTIEEGDTDGLVGPFGEPLRPVPVELFKGDKDNLKVDAAWKPAYWHPANKTICYAPEIVQ